jgi:hypothetical protein
MTWLANLLMIVGTSLGVYGAASAYYVPIDAPDAEIIDLTLNDNAGAKLGEKAQLTPLFQRGQKMDAVTLAALRENSQGIAGHVAPWRFVRVKEFSWARWPGKWITSAGTLMLLVGALIARRHRDAGAAMIDEGSMIPITSESLGKLGAEIDQLLARPTASETAANQQICDVTDELQKRWITPLLRAQNALVAQQGIGRAADPLATFAAVERNLYRAWSAAADGYVEEAIAALRNARQQTALTQEKLAALEAKPR